MWANELTREIIGRIKSNHMGEFSDGKVWVEISRQKINIDYNFENYHIGGITKNDKFYINIFLGEDFS
mgnify:CR=1 FL=1